MTLYLPGTLNLNQMGGRMVSKAPAVMMNSSQGLNIQPPDIAATLLYCIMDSVDKFTETADILTQKPPR